jgi:hypothetical protein
MVTWQRDCGATRTDRTVFARLTMGVRVSGILDHSDRLRV